MEPYFSKELKHKILAKIVQKFREKRGKEGQFGRTQMQKLTYFIKASGIELPFKFEILHYGPFCSDILETSEELLFDKVLIDESSDKRSSNYFISDEGKRYLEEDPELATYENQIELVVEGLGNLTLKELELISTLHFLSHAERAKGKVVDRNAVVQKFIELKEERFTKSAVEGKYDDMQKIGLIPA